MSTSSDYRKADSECDDGSFSQRKKSASSLCGSQSGPVVTTNPTKIHGVRQGGGRRKGQSRSKTVISSSQNIPTTVSDDDSDAENGRCPVDKSTKNYPRKRKDKEKVYFHITLIEDYIFNYVICKYNVDCLKNSYCTI